MQDLTLIVEGDDDSRYVSALLNNARFDNIMLKAAGGLNVMLKFAELEGDNGNFAYLLDSDAATIVDGRSDIHKKFVKRTKVAEDRVFVAIPTIEAWLFADIKTLERFIDSEKIDSSPFRRITTPEEISYPKYLAGRWLEKDVYQQIFATMDLRKACSASASLNDFIVGIGKLSGNNTAIYSNLHSNSFDMDIIANLIREYSDGHKIVYKSLDGEKFTAQEMIAEVSKETPIGIKYAENVLRTARDLIAYRAIKND